MGAQPAVWPGVGAWLAGAGPQQRQLPRWRWLAPVAGGAWELNLLCVIECEGSACWCRTTAAPAPVLALTGADGGLSVGAQPAVCDRVWGVGLLVPDRSSASSHAGADGRLRVGAQPAVCDRVWGGGLLAPDHSSASSHAGADRQVEHGSSTCCVW